MNKKICIKLLICIICIMLFSLSLHLTKSQAIGDIISDADDFLDKGEQSSSVIDTDALSDTSNTIYNMLYAIAVVVAVIVAMILGIQFMLASADDKAKIKEALMPYIAGCIVVFGSFTIWKMLVRILQSSGGTGSNSTNYLQALDDEIGHSFTGDGDIKYRAGQILGYIQIIGTVVAVGMMMVLGIKYMLGSSEEKAEYKKSMFPYFIGAVITFGAVNIAQLIYNFIV